MTYEEVAGFNICHYQEISSTNMEALDLIKKGIANETIIIADRQTAGRGRSGKNWISPEGNFYASLIIKTEFGINQVINVNKLTELTFVSAVAVGNTLDLLRNGSSNEKSITHPLMSFQRRALESNILFSGSQCRSTGMTKDNARNALRNDLELQYKWPNDILIDGKKISGILLEKVYNSNWLVIGIGININNAPLFTATCISDYGISLSNMDLLKKLVVNFNKVRKQWLFDGFHAIREMWLKRAFKLNDQISIKLADKLYEGIFTDIDKSGKLILQQKDDSLVYFEAGELV